MKKFIYLFLLVIAFGCSGDDDGMGNGDGNGDGSGDGDSNGTTFENYFPLTQNNSWEYNVNTTDDQGTPPTTSTDVITAVGTTMINNLTYFDLDANAEATGTMTGLLTENFIRKNEGKYHMEGEILLELSALGGQDVSIALNDLLILDESATSGSILGTVSGTTTQTIQTFDVTIDYELRTVQQGTFATHSVDNGAITYDNVIKSQIIVEATVSTVISSIPVTILPSQDVLTIDNYYAKDIGLVDSNSVFTYTLNQLPIDLGIPDSVTSTTTQELSTYTVANE